MPLIALVVGILFFALKIMGAGDSKYLSSLLLLCPYDLHKIIILNIAYVTIVVGAIVFIVNVVRKRETFWNYLRSQQIAEAIKSIKSRFSYSPVMFLSWIWLGWRIKVFDI